MDDNEEILFKDYENGTNLKKASKALEEIIKFAELHSIIYGVVAEENEHRIPSVEMVDIDKEGRLIQVDFVLNHFNKRHPDTIFIVPKKLSAPLESILFYKYSKVSGGEKSFKRAYEACKDRVVGFQIHAYFGSACVSYSVGYHGFFEVDPEYDPYNDDDDDEIYGSNAKSEAEVEVYYAEIEKLAQELSLERSLGLTRNREQRMAVAKKFFGDRWVHISKNYATDWIGSRAVEIYDLDVLPRLTKELLVAGKSAKEISDELGISLAKAKKYIAVVK